MFVFNFLKIIFWEMRNKKRAANFDLLLFFLLLLEVLPLEAVTPLAKKNRT